MATKKQPKTFASITVAGKRIDLCRLTYNARLSQETNAYAADLWVDGVHFCTAENSGHGGPDNYHPVGNFTQKDIRELDELCKKNIPAIESHGMSLDYCLEMVVGELISDWQAGKQLDRLLSTNFPFHDPVRNKIVSFKGTIAVSERPKFRAVVVKDHPKATILHDLPRDEALRLFKKAT